jgi:hypothetical protein
MIDAVVTRFGFARMPFGRDLPPSRLHRHADCGEAAARITWAVADLAPAGHTVIYIGNPATGVRGILAHVVTALGGKPVHGTAALAVQAWTVLAGERHARLGTSGDRLRAPRRCQTRRRGQAGVQAGAAQRRGQGIQAGPQRPGTRNQRRADERSR